MSQIVKKSSPDELLKAFAEILDSANEEYGLGTSSGKRHMSENQLQAIENLHKFVADENSAKPTPPTKETIKICDEFIDEWESTGIKSAAVQQLIALLNRPHIQGLLWSAEDVSSARFAPELPPIPFEVDEDDGIAVKIVRIVRRDEPLGATIKCDNGRVFVARIMAGGVADRSGCIQEGDRVLEVNGETVIGKKADEIVHLLNKCDGGTVTFKLVPAEVWHNHSSKAHQNNNDSSKLHLKALFDYDGTRDQRHPCPEAALSFKKGDILEILVCNDEYWWQAKRLGYGAFAYARERDSESSNKGVGLIPSELLQQRSKALENGNEKKSSCHSLHRGARMDRNSEELHYETVCRWNNRQQRVRPVVLIGPPGVGRNELKRRILMLFPERFSTTVPHTTRKPRIGETEGVDYYFSARKTVEKMIENDEMLEFGEFKGNLYGTAVSAVRMAIEKATPLLTPHPLALRHLRTPEFSPIIVFVQPPPFHDFKETREAFRSRMTRAPSANSTGTSQTANSSMGRAFSDQDIKQIIENSQSIEKQYGHLFDAKIQNANLEDTISDLIKLLQAFEHKASWVPLSWASL